MTAPTVPLRLLVHFYPAAGPLAQVTVGRAGPSGGFYGAGTRALDLSNPARSIPLRNAHGQPTGEHITVEHALAVLAALARDEGS